MLFAFTTANAGGDRGESTENQLDFDIQKSIADFRLHGASIPKGSECEKILTQTARRIGNALSAKEIEETLPIILKATGERLTPPPPAPTPSPTPSRSHVCFTGGMKVLTPQGERPIEELQPGDEVVSIETIAGIMQPVRNKIAYVFPHDEEDYGLLSDLPRPIQVTRRHQFWVAPHGVYLPIEEISPDAGLAYNLTEDWMNGNPPQLVPRGQFRRNGKARVYDLQLEGEPRNFIIQGILVHNIRVKS